MADEKLDDVLFKSVISRFCASHYRDLEVKQVQNGNLKGLLITRRVHYFFPSEVNLKFTTEYLKPRSLETMQWGCDSGKQDVQFFNVCAQPVRILVSKGTLTASLQVFNSEISQASEILLKAPKGRKTWSVSDSFRDMLLQLSEQGGNEICDGISPENMTSNLEEFPNGLNILKNPFLRLTSVSCAGLVKAPSKTSNFTYQCKGCQEWTKKASRSKKSAVSVKKRKATTTAVDAAPKQTSSKRVRKKKNIDDMITNGKNTNMNTDVNAPDFANESSSNIDEESDTIINTSEFNVKLNTLQSEELAKVISKLSTKFNADLNAVIFENSNKYMRGIISDIWEADKKSALQFIAHSKSKSKKMQTSWSLLTYRLVMATYYESPWARSELKKENYSILKLPACKPNVIDSSDDLDLALSDFWKEFESEKVPYSKKSGEGLLFYCDYIIKANVAYSPVDEEILGLTLESGDCGNLKDLNSLFNPSRPLTRHYLQTMWRDISSDGFEFLGPSVKWQSDCDNEKLLEFLMNSIQKLESFSFHVKAIICNGNSQGLSLIRHSLSQNELEDLDYPSECVESSAWFRNPYRTEYDKVFWLIRPRHVMSALMQELYSSRTGGTKHLKYNGLAFGWDGMLSANIMDQYESDIDNLLSNTRFTIETLLGFDQLEEGGPKVTVDQVQLTCKFLRSAKLLYEKGFLCKENLDSLSHHSVKAVKDGFEFFDSWHENFMEENIISITDPDTDSFLEPNNWESLRLTVSGYLDLLEDIIQKGCSFSPERIDGCIFKKVFAQESTCATAEELAWRVKPVKFNPSAATVSNAQLEAVEPDQPGVCETIQPVSENEQSDARAALLSTTTNPIFIKLKENK